MRSSEASQRVSNLVSKLTRPAAVPRVRAVAWLTIRHSPGAHTATRPLAPKSRQKPPPLPQEH
eukprot:scaffold4815_cov72-Phaeocystis_antarctica.AAC.1